MTEKMLVVIVVLLSLLLVVSGVAVSCILPTAVKLDMDDDGREVDLEVGQSLVITLETYATAGYTWEVAELNEQVLYLVKKESKPVSKAIGAPTMETFRFEAVKAGQTALKLVYHRPWEKNVDVEPPETFSVQVVIR